MKKIININLAGRVVPIEDAAYEILKRYIESLRRYFALEEGRDEIISDIESRISELMNEKVKKGSAAITEVDVEEIISSMGRVEDFEQAEAFETAGAAGTAEAAAPAGEQRPRFQGRLYRDASDKILGGVCSGIANYANIDPAIVRLLFVLVTFGGFGMGFLLYILLWIILPARDLEAYVGKRLFRNPDDRIFGGVSGGLAAYFNKKPWTIRIIFAAPILLNIFISLVSGIFEPWGHNFFPFDFAFGTLTGTFVMAYIVLWIVLPIARSPFEKMEMRGEKVDVASIRQNVKDEMELFRTKAHAWGEEVKTSAKVYGTQAREFVGTHGSTIASEMAHTARPVARGLGYAIGLLFKAFFLFVAGCIAFGLFMAVMAFLFGGVAQPFNDFLLGSPSQKVALWCTLLFFLGVPMVALITWIVRRMMKVRSHNNYLGWTFGGLWLLGFISLGLFTSSMVSDFRYHNRVKEPVGDLNPAGGRLTVRVDEEPIRYSGTFGWIDSEEGFDLTEDSLHLANVRLRIHRSTDSFYHVAVYKYSAGRNRQEAQQRAGKIRYAAFPMDSVLVLQSGYAMSREQKFRGQRVEVEIRVPVGKKLRFDESVGGIYHAVNFKGSGRGRWDRDWEMDWNDDDNFDWHTNTDYIMTESGELEEVGKKAPPSEEGIYEYRKTPADSLTQPVKSGRNHEVPERPELPERPERKEQPERPEAPEAPEAPERSTVRAPLTSFPFII
ncbi:PspC domain-containing protein [Paraflavisolibacter sp. H34]|uniref:PspC domain-containing protein n=1 Tax=Huijunlia imazamoxiresistens TaxID=3127457 RepID=UPI003018E07C